MSTIKQVMKIKTDRHFVLKKEENNSPNAEKNERLRGRNGRSTSKKEKSGRARGGGKEDGRAPSARRGRARGPARTPTPAASGPTRKAAVVGGVRPTEANARSGQNAYTRRAQPDNGKQLPLPRAINRHCRRLSPREK